MLLSSAILLKMDQPQNVPTLPAEHYRRKAAEARRAAEGVMKRAIKARLLDLARSMHRESTYP